MKTIHHVLEITTPRDKIFAAPVLVGWECVGGHEPWAENTFRFELAEKGSGTVVRFWQNYARELSDDAYGTYNSNWGYYLESLRLFGETGTGKPFQPIQ